MTISQMVTSTKESSAAVAAPSLLVILGASGDLTKRLLMPALYNLTCDGLLPAEFAVIGMSRSEMTHEQFREKQRQEFPQFCTRKSVDPEHWNWLESRLYYSPGNFTDADAYARLKQTILDVGRTVGATGNTLLYLAISPDQFDLVNQQLDAAGFHDLPGAVRIIVEKPFGKDLHSAIALNQSLLAKWREDQIYRIDHYLGKETVQNILAFRLANGIFDPLWNHRYIDHIQVSAMETVGVESRGAYYDKSGVIRDMIQNHLFQMLAYVCMEPPQSMAPDAVRDEKARLLQSIRLLDGETVSRQGVRGQYSAGVKADGSPTVGYREERNVDRQSNTETFAALKLEIDNPRWAGTPVYLRSGKSLWKRGTEIVVQFKPAAGEVFENTPAQGAVQPNLLIFHIQPAQGVEFRVQAKRPGPTFALQRAGMRFDYAETFEAQRGTGYEVLLYSAMNGDPTLFSRTDFVETAWRIVQPVLDTWSSTPAAEFPNYNAGTWGPRAACELLVDDGRRWHEILNRDVLIRSRFLKDANPVFLNNLMLAVQPFAVDPGEIVVRQGECTGEMYYICRGELEVLDSEGNRVAMLPEGEFFGEMSLLFNQPRSATVRAIGQCDLFVLDRSDFQRILRDFPKVEGDLRALAQERKHANDRQAPQPTP